MDMIWNCLFFYAVGGILGYRNGLKEKKEHHKPWVYIVTIIIGFFLPIIIYLGS